MKNMSLFLLFRQSGGFFSLFLKEYLKHYHHCQREWNSNSTEQVLLLIFYSSLVLTFLPYAHIRFT